MYKEEILNHSEFPQNYGKLKSYDYSGEEFNPFCGDKIKVYLKLKSQKIEDIAFESQGCIIAKASASVFSEFLKGKKVTEILKMDAGDILDLIKIELSPNRIKCAELVLLAIKNAIK